MMNKLKSLKMGSLIFLVYFLAWALLMIENHEKLSLERSTDIFSNAMIISLFIGLGLNVNAFQSHNKNNIYKTVYERLVYLQRNFYGVITFFVVPFLVSSASGVAMIDNDNNLMTAIFGTDNILLILVAGFVTCILLPAIYVILRFGWRDKH